ncbi:cysteine--tRNA ligase [Leptospira kobayashii]|uniref:Cysteine--tRNA ligase n=1 Tax=Leptospira kobayashii TaxID=1917830 RepID=A0ABM7UJ73_9LEPT|nr:cysteine--tRNA ligase [Leptospira kobayashii]BDA78863.1 cysteine--tRNA ligase [Leptospira kobayashii]
MSFQFYNSKSGKKEPFLPKDPNRVKIYSCGPTVYNFAHIGNIRSFLFVDVLRRALLSEGYVLDQSMNITDIDDKIINASIEKKLSVEEITAPWTKAFFEDLESLNILKLEHYPKATESIEDMVDLVHRLQKNGLVYEKDGSLYYSIQKFKGYGELSKIDVAGMKSGVRNDADEYEKDDVRDFVLWKNQKSEGEKSWETDLGKGRPGWHLECSAMIRKVYGSGVDIHTGGIDLLFPHHENEHAQSQGAYPEEEFVTTWLHCEHLLVEGEKMSKSKGNFFTLRDILEKGYDKKQIRYLLISSHYRSKLNFSLAKLEEAKQALERIQTTLFRILESLDYVYENPERVNIQSIKAKIKNNQILSALTDFESGFCDDLNLPKSLGSLFEFIKEINQSYDKNLWVGNDHLELVYYFLFVDSLLGVLDFKKESPVFSLEEENEINGLVEERAMAKKNKNFARADEIRNILSSRGIQLLDTKEGITQWKKVQ